MAIQVNVHEAKTRLSDLLGRVEGGEDVVIARSGTPVARLVSVNPLAEREFGIVDLRVPESFFEPMEEAELAAWE